MELPKSFCVKDSTGPTRDVLGPGERPKRESIKHLKSYPVKDPEAD